MKLPAPLPSVVFELAMVGLGEVLQHTPRAVTFAPPSLVMLPPEVSDNGVTEDASAVVRVGKMAVVAIVT